MLVFFFGNVGYVSFLPLWQNSTVQMTQSPKSWATLTYKNKLQTADLREILWNVHIVHFMRPPVHISVYKQTGLSQGQCQGGPGGPWPPGTTAALPPAPLMSHISFYLIFYNRYYLFKWKWLFLIVNVKENDTCIASQLLLTICYCVTLWTSSAPRFSVATPM